SNDIPSIKNATILQGIFVLTPTGTPLLPAWQPDSVATVRVCPPVIVPPTLQPIPDRSICPGRSTILQASPGFASYTWSDGSTASSLSTNAEGSYWIDARDVCGRSQYDTVVVTVLPNPTKSVILTLNAGSSVVLGGEFYYAPDTVTVPEPSLSGGCDTLTTYYLNLCESKTAQDTLRFYPGQKVTLGGNVYSQPGQVVLYLATAEGCDSTVTYTLEWIKAQVDISCPADTVLATLPGAPWRIVEYPLPTYTTDCPDPDVALVLLEGRYVADTFPLGPTRVCYYAFTTCGVRDTCCFTVRVLPTPSQLGIACPLNQTVTAALGEASAAVSYPLPLVSTDCYDSTAVFDLLSGLPSGADFPIGTTAVCYAAANRCGNRDSCCFSVEVLPAPAFLQVTCPPNRILSASPGGTATLHYPRPGVETDCPDTTVILTLLQGLPSGADFPVGLTAVCYEAANRCGIRDTCCFTVQVLPPPTLLRLSCPANLTVTASATGTATVSYLLPTAVTDCPDPALAYALLQGLPSGSAFPVGTTPVCYEATNRCGIHDTCCFQIQVQTPS
ncbi:MAG TPA: HYR domain-containing protein, partial [Myxococcota bacterium]|nr:HYR domain-containing protein [Myxococcota bacterium]